MAGSSGPIPAHAPLQTAVFPPLPCAVEGGAAYSPLSSSLDPLETCEHPGILLDRTHTAIPRDDFRIQPLTQFEASFRHSGWAPDRQRVWTALNRCHEPANRLDRFAECGSACWVQASRETDDVRLVANCCHDRFCLPCGQARSRNIAHQVAALIEGKDCRFLTLTLKANYLTLDKQVKRLYRCWRELRRRRDFRDHVAGGVAFVEIKIGENSGAWHPHLHVIVEGSYWTQKAIGQAWYEITGDSYVVHIARPTSPQDLTDYVTKYASKPADPSVFRDPDKLAECVVALKGVHLAATFGTFRGIRLNESTTDPALWRAICPLEVLISEARDPTNLPRQALLRRLRDKYPFLFHEDSS